MTPDPTLRRRQRSSAAWLLVWAVALAWLMHRLLTAWPHAGHPAQLALLLAMPGLLFRSLDLLFMRQRQRVLRGWRRWALRAVALPCGLALAMPFWGFTDRQAMARFETRMAPLVAQIERQRAAPCPPAAHYDIDAGLSRYLASSGALPKPAALHHAPDRFLLSVTGRAFDIDGCTIVYDSTTGAWQKFHNDAQTRSAEFDAVARDLPVCDVPLTAAR